MATRRTRRKAAEPAGRDPTEETPREEQVTVEYRWTKRSSDKHTGRRLSQAEQAHFSTWHWLQTSSVLTQGLNDGRSERNIHDVQTCRDIQTFCLGMAMECLFKLYCMVEEVEYPEVHCLQELAATEGIEEHTARFMCRVRRAKVKVLAIKITRRPVTRDEPRSTGDILDYFDNVVQWNTVRYAFAHKDPNRMRYYVDDAQALFDVINAELGVIATKLGW